MILLPNALGTVNAPPLMTVPGGAVVIEDTWQMEHPIALNSCCPCCAADVANNAESTGGALVARMNCANLSISAKWVTGSVLSSGSLVVLHTVVVSVAFNRLVMPCSLM